MNTYEKKRVEKILIARDQIEERLSKADEMIEMGKILQKTAEDTLKRLASDYQDLTGAECDCAFYALSCNICERD